MWNIPKNKINYTKIRPFSFLVLKQIEDLKLMPVKETSRPELYWPRWKYFGNYWMDGCMEVIQSDMFEAATDSQEEEELSVPADGSDSTVHFYLQ